MKERPILFSGPMVTAILEGRKTQTRRVISPQPDECEAVAIGFNKAGELGAVCGCTPPGAGWLRCPYGKPGDRLWVRESYWRGVCWTWVSCEDKDWDATGDIGYGDQKPTEKKWPTEEWQRRPSIFMPRANSRITLKVVKVRVERIQDISHDDVLCEGTPLEGQFAPRKQRLTIPQIVFSHRWDALNGKRSFGWEKNPWVWVVEFKRVEAARG